MPRPLAVLLVIGVAACWSVGDPAAVREELLEADRAFAAASAERGVEGWVEFFAEDGSLVRADETIRGHDAIRRAMATGPVANPEVTFTWDPREARASLRGDLGYTIGHWEIRQRDDATLVSEGTYLTVWRRQTDGTWKVETDIGNVVTPD